MTPQSQKPDVRPISFVLDDQAAGTLDSLALVIRPEDLTRVEPSRLTVQQTLGGAWGDNFGPGVPSIQIAGHTGWRGAPSADGLALFQGLHDTVFAQWHKRRADAVKSGLDPNKVKLIFADKLDDFAWLVAPTAFTLKRSKTRPLLAQYQISLAVLSTKLEDVAQSLDALAAATESPASQADAGAASLTDSIDKIVAQAKDIEKFIDQTLGAPVKAFMNLTAGVLAQVLKVEGAVNGIAGSLLSVAANLTQAGANLFRAVAGVLNLPNLVRARLMEVAAAFTNAFCVLANVFNLKKLFPDYSPLYGASTCSSTTGAGPLSPLRNTNSFALLSPQPTPAVAVSATAQGALTALRTMDPVLHPLPTPQLAAAVGQVASGVALP